jgi:hypothetical protein
MAQMTIPDHYSRRNTGADAGPPAAIEGDTAMTGNCTDTAGVEMLAAGGINAIQFTRTAG